MADEEKKKLLADDDDNGYYGTSGKSKKNNKDDDDDLAAAPATSLRDLYRYADTKDVILLIIGMLGSIVTGAGTPLMSMVFGGLSNTFISAQTSFDSGTLQSDAQNLTLTPRAGLSQMAKDAFSAQVATSCLQYTYIGIAILICGYIQMACWITVCEKQINNIRRKFFYSIMRQNIAWFDKNSSGKLTAQLSDNLERIKEGIGDKFGLLIQYTVQCVAGVIVAMIYSWKATLVMMSLSPLLVGSSAFIGKLVATSVRRETQKYAVAGSIAEEVLSSIRTVAAFNGQKRESARYQAALERAKRDGIFKNVWTGIGLSVMFFTIFSSMGLAFWYGSVLILNNEIAQGDVFVVFMSVMMGSMALGNAGPQFATFAAAKGAAASIYHVIDRVPEIDTYSDEGERISDPKGQIEFSDVFFNYPTRKAVPVLQGISFTAKPGETVALVGPSGCGKSTAVQLLSRFYDPDSGNISIDGVDLRDLNINWLRNLVGLVAQEPILFECSVEENIRFGRNDVTNQEMVRACKMANAHEFISKLPDGYGTMVGEGGTAMSGGQKQRIAIARALVRDPKILLLDEATSALDAESESVVQQALDKAQEGRTTIVIAHRLSTIRNASKIIALDAGRIIETGSHSELMELEGLYYDLVTNQVFHDAGPGEESEEDEKSGDDGDPARERRLERKLTRKLTQYRSRGESMAEVFGLSNDPDLDDASERRRRMSRMLSQVDTETERLKKELADEGGEASSFARIVSECREEWGYIILGLLGAAGRGIVFPVFSYCYSEIFQVYSLSGQEMVDGTRFWALVFVGIGLINFVFTMCSIIFIGLAGENISMRLRLAVFDNVLRQDIGYFDSPKHSTGKICTRLATDTSNVKSALDFRFATVLCAVISMVAGTALAFFFGWQLALVVLAIFPFFALGSYIRTALREGSAGRDADLLEEAGKVATEGIENVRTVQSLTQEETFYKNFCTHLEMPYREGRRQAQIQAISFAFAQAIQYFMYAVCFRFGAFMVDRDEMSPIDVYRVFFAVNFSGMMIGMATAYFPEYMKARFSAGLIFKMIHEEPKIDSCSEAGVQPEINGAIMFSDIFFTYPARVEAPVLQGLTFDLTAGKTLAFVGPSGCGKSTVVSLLERFYDPLSGYIKIGDFDLRTINLPYMRRHIALVSQEPTLFDCSIEDNITYGLKDISHEKVVEAAQKSNIHNFIRSLPEGYDTSVGEKGTQLSGGQKQRIAIARALVRDPQILLLDEATSALDTESEKIVQEALDRAREGRTSIVIAHRLSTVQNADSIAVIKSGRVVEQGTHSELIAQRGAYYNLTKKQNLAV